jgi:hypothetical protein
MPLVVSYFLLNYLAPLDSSRPSQSLFAIFDTIQVFMCNRKGKFSGRDAQTLEEELKTIPEGSIPRMKVIGFNNFVPFPK